MTKHDWKFIGNTFDRSWFMCSQCGKTVDVIARFHTKDEECIPQDTNEKEEGEVEV